MKVCTNKGDTKDCECIKRGCEGCYWYKEKGEEKKMKQS